MDITTNLSQSFLGGSTFLNKKDSQPNYQKDYEKKVTLKKGANDGVLYNVSPEELKSVIDRLQNYKKSEKGLFGGLMSIFKHK